MFIAAGVLALFFFVWVSVGFPLTLPALVIGGIALDMMGRFGNFVPSLKEFYATSSVWETVLWAGIAPVVLTFLVWSIL